MDTRPSTPSEASHARFEDVARVADVVGGDGADRGVDVGAALGQLLDLAVVGVALGERLWKIDGLVVTPTTLLVSISSCRLPDCSRSRDRSSSQTDTPAALSAARFGF